MIYISDVGEVTGGRRGSIEGIYLLPMGMNTWRRMGG